MITDSNQISYRPRPVSIANRDRFVLLTLHTNTLPSSNKPKCNRTRRLKKAIGYLRVSTENQELGAGLDLQRQAIEAFAQTCGYEVTEWLRDAVSGVDDPASRPGCKQAINAARTMGIPLIVDGLDRLSREENIIHQLRRELRVISTRSGETPDLGVIMAEAARAEAEHQRIRETTRDGLARARAHGSRLGNPRIGEVQSLGTQRNAERADRQARELAPIVRDLITAGAATHNQIAQGLNDAGYRPTRGGCWSKPSVRRLRERLERLSRKEIPAAYHDDPLWGIFA